MRTREEIEESLKSAREWLDENEGSGAREEGVEVGWAEALAWVLEESEDDDD